jgi:hypothetical protein
MATTHRIFAIFATIILLAVTLQPAVAQSVNNQDKNQEPSYVSPATASSIAALAQMRATANQQQGSGIDLNALLDAVITAEAEDGLLLINKKNTWNVSPENHYEMVECVDEDALWESSCSGFGIVDGVNQEENIHGADANYTSYYEAYFHVDTSGTWKFATDSNSASEIEIDGEVVASWYGGHGSADDWSHNSEIRIRLEAGWHRFVYRHEACAGEPVSKAAFKTYEHLGWRSFSTAELTIKSFPYEEGLLLINRKNTWKSEETTDHPEDHDELFNCVERYSSAEIDW